MSGTVGFLHYRTLGATFCCAEYSTVPHFATRYYLPPADQPTTRASAFTLHACATMTGFTSVKSAIPRMASVVRSSGYVFDIIRPNGKSSIRLDKNVTAS